MVWVIFFLVFFLLLRRPPRCTQSRSSAASDVYKRQHLQSQHFGRPRRVDHLRSEVRDQPDQHGELSLIHISEPTRLGMISYAVFCLKKKKHRYTSTKPKDY